MPRSRAPRVLPPAERAGYVVERLQGSDLVPSLQEPDWAQIRQQLEAAYSEIADSRRRKIPWARVRLALGALAVVALVVGFQWQLDLLWRAHGASYRTMLIPLLMTLPAYAVLRAVAGVVFLVAQLSDRDFGRAPKDSYVSGGRLVFGSAVGALIVWALVAGFHYTWPQTAVIVIVESLAWGTLIPELTDHANLSLRRAADPRDLLIADLAAFLVVAAVDLENSGETRHLLFSQPGWAHRPQWDRMADRNTAYWNSNAYANGDQILRALGVSSDVFEWRQNRSMRRLFAEGLETAADRTESRLPKIAGGGSPEVRSSVQHSAARIAATLRKYAADIVLGGTERDQELPGVLASALVNAAWGRWSELGSEDPAPIVARFLKRYGPRLLAAAVLVAAGTLVPIWFPAWIGDAAAHWRIVLFTTAALSLTEGPKVITDQLSKQAQSLVDRP